MNSKTIVLLALLIGFASCKNESSIKMEDNQTKIAKPESYKYEGTPLRIGVVGLVHTHVHWILGREKIGDIEIVGIVEPNRKLAKKYSEQHGYSMDIVFNSIDEMVKATNPEAVTDFGTIYGHLATVEYCAPKGIHVMVEKPLAVNMNHANKMIHLAKQHNIQLLTNYETSWHKSVNEAFRVIENNTIGTVRKVEFYTGHPGPIEIGCNPEFLEWLTDPVLNGGGALTDFGCYGANIATAISKGKTPNTVFCKTQQIKPDSYPKVEDDATVILNYDDGTQVVIQASWNWPYNRKDMDIYGQTGTIRCFTNHEMDLMTKEEDGFKHIDVPEVRKGIHDPFAMLNEVIKGDYQLPAFDVSSVENNEIVMQILEAAKQSAMTGEVVKWDQFFKNAK
ncbi:Gfo/Idh/MocA family oxidoreductase [Spongiivirga sp. MCCC 1A20706]|uniref:Gfo/Idh/MocA family protein n=1 Tax=Spongiivirga sp. MCCC 1A20706 TaxID=3160963 RepID=UPI003977773B